MTVYVLLRGHDYEGESLVDVFATAQSARDAGQARNLVEGNMPEELHWQSNDVADICNGKWSVYECQVLP